MNTIKIVDLPEIQSAHDITYIPVAIGSSGTTKKIKHSRLFNTADTLKYISESGDDVFIGKKKDSSGGDIISSSLNIESDDIEMKSGGDINIITEGDFLINGNPIGQSISHADAETIIGDGSTEDPFSVNIEYFDSRYSREDPGVTPADTLNILFDGINPSSYTVSSSTPTNIIAEAREGGAIVLPILDDEKSVQIQVIGGSFVEINGTQYGSGTTIFATLNLDGAAEWVITSTTTTDIPPVVDIPSYKDITVNKIILSGIIAQQSAQSDVFIISKSGVDVNVNDIVFYYPKPGYSLEHTGIYKVLSKTTAGGIYKIYTQKIASYLALDIIRLPEYMGGIVIRSLYDGGNASTIGFKAMDCHDLYGYTEITPSSIDSAIGTFELPSFSLSPGQKILVNNKLSNTGFNGVWIKLASSSPFSTLIKIANVEFVDTVRIDGVDDSGDIVRDVFQSKYIGSDSSTKYYEPAGVVPDGSKWEDASLEDKEVKLGYLYNNYAATDSRKITSSDEWRVPLEADFVALKASAGADQGSKLKEVSADYWLDTTGHTNTFKFNARGNGLRDATSESFIQYKNRFFAQGSELSGSSVILFMLIAGTGTIGISKINNSQKNGYGIRLVKTSTALAEGEEGLYTGNDGHVYKTVCIGGVEWMSENLIETKYRNAEDIPVVVDAASWKLLEAGARCSMNNDESLAFSGTSTTSDIIAPKEGKKVHANSIVGLPSRLAEFTPDIEHRTVSDVQIEGWDAKPSVEYLEENYAKKTAAVDPVQELFFDDRNNVYTSGDIANDSVVAKIDLDVTGYITLLHGLESNKSILIQVIGNGDNNVKLILVNDDIETEYSVGTTIFAIYNSETDVWTVTSSETVEVEVVPDYSDVSVKKMLTSGAVLVSPGNNKRVYFAGATGLSAGDLVFYNVGSHYFTGLYRMINGSNGDRIAENTTLRTVRVSGDEVYYTQYDGTNVGTVLFVRLIDLSVNDTVPLVCSNETDDIVASSTTPKLHYVFRDLFNRNLLSIVADLNTAATGSSMTIDIKKNGTSIFSTLLTIDSGETSSLTAAVPYALTGAITFTAGDYVDVYVTIAGSTTGGKGLKVNLLTTKTL